MYLQLRLSDTSRLRVTYIFEEIRKILDKFFILMWYCTVSAAVRCTENPVKHRMVPHSVTWRLYIREWKIYVHCLESQKTNFIMQVKEQYQNIKSNHRR